MLFKLQNLCIITLVFVSLQACASTKDLGAGKTGKYFTVSGKSYDAVWDATVKGLQSFDAKSAIDVEKTIVIKEQDKEAGVIKASSGMSLMSWGEVIGVFVTPPKNAKEHKIEVESRRKMQTNVFAANWEDRIIESIKKQLDKK